MAELRLTEEGVRHYVTEPREQLERLLRAMDAAGFESRKGQGSGANWR